MAVSVVFFPPISTMQGLSAAPIRSTPPRARQRSSAMSKSRYLKLVEPRLATRIFMVNRRVHAANASAGEVAGLTDERFKQTFGRPRDHVAADELADLLGGLRAGFY